MLNLHPSLMCWASGAIVILDVPSIIFELSAPLSDLSHSNYVRILWIPPAYKILITLLKVQQYKISVAVGTANRLPPEQHVTCCVSCHVLHDKLGYQHDALPRIKCTTNVSLRLRLRYLLVMTTTWSDYLPFLLAKQNYPWAKHISCWHS